MPYKLFDSVDELLAPQTLSELSGQPVAGVRRQFYDPADSKSGNRFLTIETNHETTHRDSQRFIVKRILINQDWIMCATDDHCCRSVTLWQYGLLGRLPPEIEHGIIACAQDDDGWAILMRDLRETLTPYAQFNTQDNKRFLNAIAALHSAFWEASELSNAGLGLCSLWHTYTWPSRRTGHRKTDSPGGNPQLVLEGWDQLLEMVEPDVADILQDLTRDPRPLCDALSRYPWTLVHGDWRHANLGIVRTGQAKVLLLDWQLATLAPPAVDLARYLACNSTLLPISKEDAILYYRQRLAHHLGTRFDESWWLSQLQLALLGGFLQECWAIALKATWWDEGVGARDHWRADLVWWSHQVRLGVQWL